MAEARSFIALTLNLWNTQGPFEARMSALRRYLLAARPDVMLMQEVALVDGAPQTESVFSGLGYALVYHAAGIWAGQTEGLAIAVQGRLANATGRQLPPAPGEIGRAALLADAQLTCGWSGLLMTTHLACRPENGVRRAHQAQTCGELAAARGGAIRDVVFGADLNEVCGPTQSFFAEGAGIGLHDGANPDADRGPTLEPANPWAAQQVQRPERVDHLAWRGTLQATWLGRALHADDGWGPVSDHYAVAARLAPKRKEVDGD